MENIANMLPTLQSRAVKRAIECNNSGWLTVLPIKRDNFDLSAYQFRDALALRYGKQPCNLPSECDGCGQPFDVQHGLDCRTGGLVIQRHNEVRDVLGSVTNLAYKQVLKEPIIREAIPEQNQQKLIADLAIRGFWQPQIQALFDIRVVDCDVVSYQRTDPIQILKRAEKEKIQKYRTACDERNCHFTPLVLSTDGAFASDTSLFVNSWHVSYRKKQIVLIVLYVRGQELVYSLQHSEQLLYAFVDRDVNGVRQDLRTELVFHSLVD
eukprot:TRINITY_DN9994_c0_g2_i4.p3 TRINITY_DN9994_c0_g2~~TRINITY_DN9994_c0_g2_i4.p3  ORF type:complete len:267 (-),score=14.02 TRINITY_DN9994_c0_g2_i4:178-978(-)